MCVALQCILVAGGLDVRQGSIWDYRDTVTGPRADTGHLGILRTGYCKEYKQVLYHGHLKILGTVIWSTSVNRLLSVQYTLPTPESPSLHMLIWILRIHIYVYNKESSDTQKEYI